LLVVVGATVGTLTPFQVRRVRSFLGGNHTGKASCFR
jgi:hypothetical protein